MIYEPAKALLLPINLSIAIDFIIFGIKIKKKEKEYIVNSLFLTAFLFWAIYLIMDGISTTFACASPSAFKIANILWDLEIFSLFAYTYTVFLIIRIIRNGENILKNRTRLIVEIVVIVIFAIIAMAYSQITIYDSTGALVSPDDLPYTNGVFQTKDSFEKLGLYVVVLAFLLNIVSLVFLTKVRNACTVQLTKQRMTYMIVGITMIPLGLLYFLLRSMFFPNFSFGVSIIGQLMFAIAPFAIWKSQN